MERQFPGDAAKWLIEEVGKRGVAPERTLLGTGLGRQWLEDDKAVLNPEQYRRLVHNAVNETRDPTIGLWASRQLSYVSRFGFWGYAILSSADWGQASRIAVQYWEVSGSLVRLDFHHEGPTCRWDIFLNLEPADDKVLIFGVEKVVSAALATVEFTTGSPAPVTEIMVTYQPPEHAVLYGDYWGAPVRFGQPVNLVRMDASVLARPVLMANTQVMEACQEQLRDLLANLRRADELVELIRRMIISSPGGFPDAGGIARRLNISPRTLRRRLTDRGTTYMNILNEVRARLATGYLCTTNLSIDEISGLLGYAETTTFRRSFKQWVGKSASAVRRESRSQGGA